MQIVGDVYQLWSDGRLMISTDEVVEIIGYLKGVIAVDSRRLLLRAVMQKNDDRAWAEAIVTHLLGPPLMNNFLKDNQL